MSRQDDFDRILASLHEAALDDTCWPKTSALIDEDFGVKGNLLGFGTGKSQEEIYMFFVRFCFRGHHHEELERRYFKVYYPLDERIPRIRRLPDSQLVHVTDLFTDQEKKTSLVYNEGMRDWDTRNSLIVRLDGPNGSRIVWNIADPVDGNDWSFDRVEKIQRVLPHLRQFVRVRQTLAEARALGKSMAELLDSTSLGVIQLDRHGRILEVNDRARDILRQNQGLSDHHLFLHAEDNDVLQEMLARALPRFGGQGVAGSMLVRRKPGMAHLTVHVSPIGRRHMDYRPQGVAALVVVVDPTLWPRIDPELVASIFDLTPAESRVAVQLAEGRTVRAIACTEGSKESTVRWHMRHIFAKLGISRQVELVQRVVLAVGGAGSRR